MTSVKVAATKVAHCQSLDCKGHTFEMSKCSDVFFSDMHGFWGRTSTRFFCVFFLAGLLGLITTKKLDSYRP